MSKLTINKYTYNVINYSIDIRTRLQESVVKNVFCVPRGYVKKHFLRKTYLRVANSMGSLRTQSWGSKKL